MLFKMKFTNSAFREKLGKRFDGWIGLYENYTVGRSTEKQ